MRKKKLFKKLIATAGAMVMALTMMMPMGVSAAYPESNETGSLTITKYKDTTSSEWDENNTVQTPPTGKDPLEGVTFTIKKVGNITQQTYTDNGTQKTSLVYEITDDAVRTMLTNQSKSPIEAGTNYYTSTDLDAALKSVTNVNEWAAQTVTGSSIDSDITDDRGKAEFTSLQQGLYLVAETAAPVDVTSKSVPFFVSIPSIVNAEGGNTGWSLNVNAYPKNAVGESYIDKKIVENSREVDYTNAQIGDTIEYIIPVTINIPADGMEQFYVMDRMTKGLTFNGTSVQIYEMVSADDRTYEGKTPLTKVDDATGNGYTVETTDGTGTYAGGTVVTFDFTDAYLDTLQLGTTHYYIIKYNCTLNSDAVIGQSGNVNAAELYYSNTVDTISAPNESTTEKKVYTYGIYLEKLGEGSDRLNGVQFSLTRSGNENINVKKGDAGYYVPDSTSDSNTVETSVYNGTNGVIYIRGLEPGDYKLTEIKTNTGYVLLKEPVTISITATSGQEENGAVSATVSGENATLQEDTVNDSLNSETAQVVLTVVNNKGFDLPQTGAAGTALFAIVGIVLAAVAGGLLFFLKRSPKRR